MSYNWIQTKLCDKFMVLDPKIEDIHIEDIATSLSNLCRFNGHVSQFYCVAQHSVLVARILPDELKFWGLLHDAAEAYVSDLPRPVKKQIPQFYEIEERIIKLVAQKFNLEWPMPPEVQIADDKILATEARDLCRADLKPEVWVGLTQQPLDYLKIKPVNPQHARKLFMMEFNRLVKK